MSIIKTYDISTVDEVKRIHNLVEKTQENNKYEHYTKENIMLVRTTDIFPVNRTIKTLANSSFIAKSNANFIYRALYNELDYESLKQLETYELYYRSTIHFAENGLVSSHMYGDFDNLPFIILEPLTKQLGKSNFRNFAGQDTFIKGNVTLSDQAIMIIKEEDYEDARKNYPEIENYKVIIYKGINKEIKEQYIQENKDDMPEFDVNDSRAIVEIVLMDLGFTPELIGSHYIIESPTSKKIRDVNCLLAEQYKVLAEAKHHHTDEYREDLNKNIMMTETFNKLLLDFILKKHNIELEIVLDNSATFKLVELVGLDKIIEDISEFNNTIEKMQEQHLLPTSEDLLNGNIPNIFENYSNNLSSKTK